ncbi:MAG TPA: hypothetical protein VGU73_12120 [Acidimicrobiia bacterium]|nr:hypothetical protein [Acidimicrobiia bacterium]
MTLLAVSVIGWILRGVIALVAMVLIYTIGAATLRKFKIAPQDPDPEQVVQVNARVRCTVCGAEVTMTAAQAGDELDAPRHCREDMVRVGPVA